MASWSPLDQRTSARGAHFVLRLGGHLLPDRELLALAARLAEREEELARHSADLAREDGREVRRQLDAARARVSRDLELLSAAVQRSGVAAH